MGNEYGAADFQPHLVYGSTVMYMVTGDGTSAHTVLAGGYHQKMRLRRGYSLVVNAALSVADVAIDVKHGGNDVVAAHASGAADSAIGTMTAMTIVDQYKDLDPDESLILKNDTATTGNGDVFVLLEYELVE